MSDYREREDCVRCLGEGVVPRFEDGDGVRMTVGYRPCAAWRITGVFRCSSARRSIYL